MGVGQQLPKLQACFSSTIWKRADVEISYATTKMACLLDVLSQDTVKPSSLPASPNDAGSC